MSTTPKKTSSFPVISAWPAMISFMTETILFCCLVAAEKRMRYRMSMIYGHPVIFAATRALCFSQHVTKRNGGFGDENASRGNSLLFVHAQFLGY